jgi:hypothetical protein
MKIRDRIKELRRVPAKTLIPNPKNWRTHPDRQKDVLKGVLAEVGYADALLARELPDGSLQLIDGHLRAETTPEQTVPVLILDLDESEADKLLTLLDPLAGLAGTNQDLLSELISNLETENAAVRQMLDEMLSNSPEIPEANELKDMPIPNLFQILIECENEEEQRELFERFSADGLKCKILNI